MRRPLRTTWVSCAVFWWAIFHLSASSAQTAAPITSSGLNTQVNVSATPPTGTIQYDVTGGTRVGTNLFHSFGEFSVPTHSIANFLNDSGLATSNILSRVTGGNGSNIFGTIQTTDFGNTNLFLMNPAGIVFGPTASLNVGGSVTFTTADYLRLDTVGGPNAGMFHADPGQTNLLTSASVAAFGFLGNNPGNITIQGSQLTVPTKQAISLIGGNIMVESGLLETGTVQPPRLSASTGQINLATASSPGEFLNDLTAGPNTNGVSFRSLGSVHLEPGSTVNLGQRGNGKVSIRGGQLILEVQSGVLDTTDSTVFITPQDPTTVRLTQESSIISQTLSKERGPDIQVVADHLQFLGSPPPSENVPGTPVKIWARADSSGDAGNIALQTTGNLELLNQVRVESGAGFTLDVISPFSPVLARGSAGHVALTSTHGNIQMTGSGTWGTSQTGNSGGKTGTVTASAPDGEIILDGGAALFTYASPQSGGGGQVKVAARNLRMTNGAIISTDNVSPFKPDGITMTLSGKLSMVGPAFIVTSAFDPKSGAPVGDISLTAKDIVVTHGSLISSETFSSGPGGQLNIVADTLQLLSGGRIKSGSTFAPPFGTLPQDITPTGPGGDISIQTLGPTGSTLITGTDSGIFTNTEGTGAGGTINLATRSLTIEHGGTISASTTGFESKAIGGSVKVTATDGVTLTNGGSITASSVLTPGKPNTGIANAGNISVNAGRQLELHNQASIKTTTQSDQANGGNIEIRAIDRVRLVNKSEISTSVNGAEGSGGNIFIDPQVVVIQGSAVTAEAIGGAGGNVTFVTPLFLSDSASIISASSQRGPSGTVTIQSPTSNISGTVGQLTAKPSPPQVLLQNNCVAKAGTGQSTFLLTGRHSLPDEPGGWLNTPVSVDHWTGEDSAHASGLMVKKSSPNSLPTMAKQSPNRTVLSLRQLTPPGFLVRSFATGSTDCAS